MNSITGIGFVFNESSVTHIGSKLSNLINYLNKEDDCDLRFKYSTDKTGNNWIEKISSKADIKNHIYQLSSGFLGQIYFRSDILNHQNLDIHLEIIKNAPDDYLGFLLNLDEIEILGLNPVFSNKDKDIIDFITDIYKTSHYACAFCDNDASIEYSPATIINSQKPLYSITVVPRNDRLKQQPM